MTFEPLYILIFFTAALLAVATWIGIHGADPKAPEPQPEHKPARRYVRGMCPHCGELDVPLRADGEPCERWHKHDTLVPYPVAPADNSSADQYTTLLVPPKEAA